MIFSSSSFSSVFMPHFLNKVLMFLMSRLSHSRALGSSSGAAWLMSIRTGLSLWFSMLNPDKSPCTSPALYIFFTCVIKSLKNSFTFCGFESFSFGAGESSPMNSITRTF